MELELRKLRGGVRQRGGRLGKKGKASESIEGAITTTSSTVRVAQGLASETEAPDRAKSTDSAAAPHHLVYEAGSDVPSAGRIEELAVSLTSPECLTTASALDTFLCTFRS